MLVVELAAAVDRRVVPVRGHVVPVDVNPSVRDEIGLQAPGRIRQVSVSHKETLDLAHGEKEKRGIIKQQEGIE